MSVINNHLSRVLKLTPEHVAPFEAAMDQMFGDFPAKVWHLNVARYLYGRGYHPASIKIVIDHSELHGSVECCSELVFDDRDRASVERLLPESSEESWSHYSQCTWASHDAN
jgi:hypothetical protein